MLSPVDQLLVTSPLLGSELRIDLGAHAGLDGIEAGPDPRPQGIGLGAVAGDDRAHRVALCGAQFQLTGQIGDERVRAAMSSRATVITFRGLVATPAGQPTGQEYSGQQADGGEFRSIQHGSLSSFYRCSTRDVNTTLASGGSGAVTSAASPGPSTGASAASNDVGAGAKSARPRPRRCRAGTTTPGRRASGSWRERAPGRSAP